MGDRTSAFGLRASDVRLRLTLEFVSRFENSAGSRLLHSLLKSWLAASYFWRRTVKSCASSAFCCGLAARVGASAVSCASCWARTREAMVSGK